jgi:hypothetical protein
VEQTAAETQLKSEELLRQLRRRQQLFVLDVHAHEEFERFLLEGPGVTAINFPYFEMLEVGGQDDMVDSGSPASSANSLSGFRRAPLFWRFAPKEALQNSSPREYFGWDMKPTPCKAACRLGAIIMTRK